MSAKGNRIPPAKRRVDPPPPPPSNGCILSHGDDRTSRARAAIDELRTWLDNLEQGIEDGTLSYPQARLKASLLQGRIAVAAMQCGRA